MNDNKDFDLQSIESKPLKFYKGVGEKRAQLFEKLGVDSSDALLRYYPREYEDWSSCVSVEEAKANAESGEVCCIRASVSSPVRFVRLRGNRTLTSSAASSLSAQTARK